MNCRGCEHLKAENWPHGVTAFRCMAPLPGRWGKGYVVGNPSKFIPSKVDMPIWCPKHPKYGKTKGAAL